MAAYELQLAEILNARNDFPLSFPVETGTCQFLKSKGHSAKTLVDNFNSAYPYMHEDSLRLAIKVLMAEKAANKPYYAKLPLKIYLNRLIKKRAVMFVGSQDSYKIVIKEGDKYVTHQNYGGWDKIGEPGADPALPIENSLTYNDMRISSLISFSSHTVFVNSGSRRNHGVYADFGGEREKLQDGGVIVGIVGSRLEKPHFMEYRDMMEGTGQTYNNPIDLIFRDYYRQNGCDEKSEMFALEKPTEDKPVPKKLNVCVFEHRVRVQMESLLVEANMRAAAEDNKKAYIHVVGFGLGAWTVTHTTAQNNMFVKAAVQTILDWESKLPHVAVVRFSWIQHDLSLHLPQNENGIKIVFENVDPHLSVGKNMLLIVTYAYDGNSYPGNEYWGAMNAHKTNLSLSSDPAAAASTQIAEIQNPFINPKISVSGLMITMKSGKMISFSELSASNPEFRLQ